MRTPQLSVFPAPDVVESGDACSAKGAGAAPGAPSGDGPGDADASGSALRSGPPRDSSCLGRRNPPRHAPRGRRRRACPICTGGGTQRVPLVREDSGSAAAPPQLEVLGFQRRVARLQRRVARRERRTVRLRARHCGSLAARGPGAAARFRREGPLPPPLPYCCPNPCPYCTLMVLIDHHQFEGGGARAWGGMCVWSVRDGGEMCLCFVREGERCASDLYGRGSDVPLFCTGGGEMCVRSVREGEMGPGLESLDVRARKVPGLLRGVQRFG